MLAEALFRAEPIEWNRLGAFQDVSLRLIAARLLPKADVACTSSPGQTIGKAIMARSTLRDSNARRNSTSAQRGRAVYIATELLHQQRNAVIRKPTKLHHLYVCDHNQGAEDLVLEINQFLSTKDVSDRSSEMEMATSSRFDGWNDTMMSPATTVVRRRMR